MPAIGSADARTYMVSDPLHAVTILFAGKDIEANLRPARNSLGKFERLTQLMVGRNDTSDVIFLGFRGEVGVQFHHQCLRCDGVCAVNLDLIVSLCRCGPHAEDSRDYE